MFFFFFQAEDGIRDKLVTGVQTCALPIWFITPNAASSTLVVRAPQNLLDAATQFLEKLDTTRPQVMLDIHVYQVSHTLTRNMGLHIPYQFNLFNIPASALAAVGGQNIQDLINQ